MVRISNDRPAALPWVLRVLGPASASLFVADLGDARQIHPRTKLAGYHIAFLPHPQFEFGAEVHGRDGRARRTAGELRRPRPRRDPTHRRNLPIRHGFPVLEQNGRHRFSLAHALVARVRAVWRGRRRRLRHSPAAQRAARGQRISARRCLSDVCSIAGGSAFAPNIIRPAFATTRTPTIPCRRAAVCIGDQLGPRAVGGYLTLDGESARAGYFSLTAAVESRSGNQYGSATNGPNTEGFHFVRTALHPAEKRVRAVATWGPDWRDGRIGARVAIGAERVSNFGFVAGNDRTNWLARTAIVIRP